MRKLRKCMVITSTLLAVVLVLLFIVSYEIGVTYEYEFVDTQDYGSITATVIRGRCLLEYQHVKQTPTPSTGNYRDDAVIEWTAAKFSRNLPLLELSYPPATTYNVAAQGGAFKRTASEGRLIVPILVPILLYLGLWVWVIRKFGKPKPGHCWKCGYNLRGTASDVCPECGVEQVGVQTNFRDA